MKLGLESLNAQKRKKVVRISSKDFDVQAAIATEAYMGVVEATNTLETLSDICDNITDVKVSVEQFGITDQLIGLVGEEISAIAPTFDKKDTKGVTIALEASLKEIGKNIIEWIKKIFARIRDFFAKLFSAQKMAIAILEKQIARLTALKKDGDDLVYYDAKMPVREAYSLKEQKKGMGKAIEIWNSINPLITTIRSGVWKDNKVYDKFIDGQALAAVKAALENPKTIAVATGFGSAESAFTELKKAVDGHKKEFDECSKQSANLKSKSLDIKKLTVNENQKQSPQKIVAAASKIVTAWGRYELQRLRQNIAVAKNISADDD